MGPGGNGQALPAGHRQGRGNGRGAETMIYGIGMDLCEIGRIRKALERWGERFAQKILVESEMQRFRRHRKPEAFLAKRFAAKEAFSKAVGRGIRHPVS